MILDYLFYQVTTDIGGYLRPNILMVVEMEIIQSDKSFRIFNENSVEITCDNSPVSKNRV